MKKFIREYGDFNVWANIRIGEVVQGLTDEQLNREVVSSFPSVKKTVHHIWGAQWIWLERFNGKSPREWLNESFTPGGAELVKEFVNSSVALNARIQSMKKKDLDADFHYSNMEGTKFVTPFYRAVTHVLNHSTYHRGQLITLFRQLGVTRVPPTDLIFYYRQQERQVSG